jgi:hypothetical protein
LIQWKKFVINSAIKQIALVVGSTLIAMADVHAQTCPTVSSDTTVTSSCDTGINLTGNNNLTIGTPTSGQVQITNTGSSISIGVTGTGNTISNTASGEISAEGGIGIYNDGTIDALTNSGTITALSVYAIENRLTINTLTKPCRIRCAVGRSIATSVHRSMSRAPMRLRADTPRSRAATRCTTCVPDLVAALGIVMLHYSTFWSY